MRNIFGKIRRKILRVLLGRELFERLIFPQDFSFFNNSLNIINNKLDQITETMKNDTYQIIKNNYEAIMASDINTKTFDKYKDIYKNYEIVLIATGSTLNYYEQLQNVINIGVNTAVLCSKIRFDYLFVQDRFSILKCEKEVLEYPCKKFFRFAGTRPFSLPRKFIDLPDVEEYTAYLGPFEYRTCHYDIRKAPLGDPGGTVAHSAVQFALWTYPKKIYLVGCDCSSSGYFSEAKSDLIYDHNTTNRLIQGWQKIKEFQQIYYPDVEIVSINPVGLKGMFNDIYTESYLAVKSKNL